ncbi:MAG TPA: hypothetical protein DCQ31_14345 [Bacteroidales bacterium]|nr:hypothetical protein [Bacteroidales bacterium]
MKHYFPILSIFALVVTGCITPQKTVMLNNLYEEQEFTNPKSEDRKYLVNNYDILHITINSFNSDVANLFNSKSNVQYDTEQQSGGGQASVTQVGGSFYFNGYTVDRFGNIELPMIGKLHVAGKSLEEVKANVQAELRKTITDAIVELKFVSFRLTITGEVAKRGIVNIYEERINILEALTIVGGMTEFARADEVLLIRATPTGSKVFVLDLTKKSIFESENFYLQPNDMIIVKPISAKIRRLNFSDYSILLSAITTTITTIVLINNINNGANN